MNRYMQCADMIKEQVAIGIIDCRSGIECLHLLAMDVCNDPNLSDEDADALICRIVDYQGDLGIDLGTTLNHMRSTLKKVEETIIKS